MTRTLDETEQEVLRIIERLRELPIQPIDLTPGISAPEGTAAAENDDEMRNLENQVNDMTLESEGDRMSQERPAEVSDENEDEEVDPFARDSVYEPDDVGDEMDNDIDIGLNDLDTGWGSEAWTWENPLLRGIPPCMTGDSYPVNGYEGEPFAPIPSSDESLLSADNSAEFTLNELLLLAAYDPIHDTWATTRRDLFFAKSAMDFLKATFLDRRCDWDILLDEILVPFAQNESHMTQTVQWFYSLGFPYKIELLIQRNVGLRPRGLWMVGPFDMLHEPWETRWNNRECIFLDPRDFQHRHQQESW
jgi:hypothetical protein